MRTKGKSGGKEEANMEGHMASRVKDEETTLGRVRDQTYPFLEEEGPNFPNS